MLTLTLAEKGGETKELSFDQTEIRVGRVRDNEIVLPKGNVSKHHCRLLVEEDLLLVEDLGSTNGTYVNGRRISEPTPVSGADRIFVGDFIIRIAEGLEEQESPHHPSVPEAGSLSTALPRRPLPPPPPMRPHEEDSGSLSGRSLHAPPPPPPPPAFRRETKAAPTEPLEGLAPPSPTDISLDDDEELSPAPRINLPPLKPPTPVLSPSPDEPVTTARGAGIPQEASTPAPISAAQVTPVPSASLSSASPSALGEGPEWLSRLLADEDVRAVFFSGSNAPEVERQGGREPASVSPSDLASLSDVLRRLAQKGLPCPKDDAAVIACTLADGTRIAAIFPPVADRLLASLVRPAPVSKSLDEMAAEEVLSPDMQEVLEACVSTKQNILITGDRAACDALLGTLAWTLDRVARVVILAETITPPASATGWIKLPIAKHPDLVAAATALRPEYVVSDVAAAGLLADILQSCVRGQNGTLATLIARSSNDALSRVRALAAGSCLSAGDMLGSSLDLLVHVLDQSDGSFKVMEIAEPVFGSSGDLRAETLLAWQSKGKGKGRFIATRTPCRLAGKLEAGGVTISDTVLQR